MTCRSDPVPPVDWVAVPQRECPHCAGTGYSDYAGFAMDLCSHLVRQERKPRPNEQAEVSGEYEGAHPAYLTEAGLTPTNTETR